MQALKEDDIEQVDTEEPILRRHRVVKDNTAGLPRYVVRHARVPKPRTVPMNKTEEEIGLTAKLLSTIESTVEGCKKELEVLYKDRNRRRRDLVALNMADSSKQDPALIKMQADIERLQRIATDRHTRFMKNNEVPGRMVPHITDYSENTRHLNGKIHDALRTPADDQLSTLADILTRTKTAPSVKSFNIMISRLSRLRQNVAAWVIFQTMLRLKYQPDAYTISSVLNLCIASGSYTDFSKILTAAREQRRIHKLLNPTRIRSSRGLVLMGTIIKGCVKFGRMRRAEVYITLMKAERIKANVEILTAMIQGYSDQGDWDRGRPHLRRLMTLPWDRKVVATLIKYCRACNRAELESKVRELAALKGVQVDDDDDDLSLLPLHFKTKGLDVPDHFKMPRKNDIGVLMKRPQRSQPEAGRQDEAAKPKSRVKVFKGKRQEALGKWA
ncbi:protein of unknown function [Taphrina deformans PYCC 5710]|uniref:Pentatricopeptide repeat protein n=1 Tax=Taphrina deformans (strain PYCC 5710 / ATCC 11124 / CBS 356.35 / IMI 108563 / JCM 9778 / NBRC 8474) TaxID=1097556 RepID=R4X7Z5_TAPDE|nr:protein of unknown function [Taphrina deformans PYCC 5710]|eukprot:CCG81595.1 protein of unknown function [Taphrina deformans PYCC 5710]